MNLKTLFTIIAVSAALVATAEPYSVINDDYHANGCHHWRVTIWDDAGTPHDHSDDIEITTSTLIDCQDQPENADPGDGSHSAPYTALLTDYEDREFTNGISGTGYTVKIMGSDQTVVAEDVIFEFEGI
jgi:hypothetical protein